MPATELALIALWAAAVAAVGLVALMAFADAIGAVDFSKLGHKPI